MNEAFVSSLPQQLFHIAWRIAGGSIIGGPRGVFYWTSPDDDCIPAVGQPSYLGDCRLRSRGTFDMVYNFERGIFHGETKDIVKQVY